MQLELQDIGYSYNGRDRVLQHVSYSFTSGKLYAITGRSGAGKTTLLSLLSQLTRPTEGKIIYNNKDISEVDQYLYRSRYVGVIFQSFNLLMNLTAVENVLLSMDIAGVKKDNNRTWVMELLEKVGLNDEEANRRILKLSGGQQQRVAIARALIAKPRIVFADEPTGNLDTRTGEDTMRLLMECAAEFGQTLIVVTHNPEIAQKAQQVIRIEDGQILKGEPQHEKGNLDTQ